MHIKRFVSLWIWEMFVVLSCLFPGDKQFVCLQGDTGKNRCFGYIFFYSKQQKNIPRDSRDTRADLHNSVSFCRLCVHLLHYTFFRPFERLVTTFGLSWYYNLNQGTLLDLHGPPNGPWNGPCEADCGGPLPIKGLPGPLHGPNWSLFLYRPLDSGLT